MMMGRVMGHGMAKKTPHWAFCFIPWAFCSSGPRHMRTKVMIYPMVYVAMNVRMILIISGKLVKVSGG